MINTMIKNINTPITRENHIHGSLEFGGLVRRISLANTFIYYIYYHANWNKILTPCRNTKTHPVNLIILSNPNYLQNPLQHLMLSLLSYPW